MRGSHSIFWGFCTCGSWYSRSPSRHHSSLQQAYTREPLYPNPSCPVTRLSNSTAACPAPSCACG
ncbi:hypothetical protein E2C01_030173 [Portunus trituberculatus]|uniref:Uncharacterized protein n=1 Tax=Portunus trituberculatus TaxID=210409 RepID=A0A5B7ETI3_PORTR|nr:hypothetical protein [Portunus trituberculatus]